MVFWLMVFYLWLVLWGKPSMNTAELILGIATLLTPVLAAWLAWQQNTINRQIRNLERRLDDCLEGKVNVSIRSFPTEGVRGNTGSVGDPGTDKP